MGSQSLRRVARWRMAPDRTSKSSLEIGYDVAIALYTDLFTRLFSNNNAILRAARAWRRSTESAPPEGCS